MVYILSIIVEIDSDAYEITYKSNLSKNKIKRSNDGVNSDISSAPSSYTFQNGGQNDKKIYF